MADIQPSLVYHKYGLFQLKWMLEHEFTLVDLMQSLQTALKENDGKHQWVSTDSQGHCMECASCGKYISFESTPDETGATEWDREVNAHCLGIPSIQYVFDLWENTIGFLGGQIWPCFEEYRDNEYASDTGKAHLLISVFERNIKTELHPTFEAARVAMLEELKDEFLKEGTEAEWDTISANDECEYDCFGFDKLTAWSNLDDDCNCDWQIVPIPPVIT